MSSHDYVEQDARYAQQLQAEEDARGAADGRPTTDYPQQENPPLPQAGQQGGYQIGAGAPLNQQYMGGDQMSGMQQGQHTYAGGAQGYAPPPQQMPASGTSGHEPQGYYPPPPSQGQQSPYSGQDPTPSHQKLASGVPVQPSQEYYPPPPPQGQQMQASSISGQASQEYYPPPPPQQSHVPAGVGFSGQSLNTGFQPPLPPRRPSAQSMNFGDDDPSSPIHYTRDPHKLVAYLVPFPKPIIKGVEPSSIPDRFLIYTPPPPPLSAPAEGEKEDKFHKVQRKWQNEVRAAKTSDAKTASWKGVKSKATKGISWAIGKTTSSNLDFVNRIPGAKSDSHDKHAEDGVSESDTTHKTVGLEEMVLIYPSSYAASPDQVKAEFINTMMRTKSKAQRDSIIATGLLPVSGAIDLLATVVWPFGGLLEVDGVWAYSSIRGAKTARSVTKRLTSSTQSGNTQAQTEEQEMAGDKLRLTFTQSPRLEVLNRYLMSRCRDYDHRHFPSTEVAPTESEVLAAIGWAPSQSGGTEKNWEDEQWETEEVKEDMRNTLEKASKEWDKWCKAFAKDPEKAMKK
ncbi:MAG: hypothetical protein ASARMPREDX12_001270 [Alectoria sarmentosa]|nr:MAG: hypothetical protein ASARMPREDX12_001270 [Alectoria sarmentosa]CAD6584595.1 MAG: hypothetical protein ASARMPRED_001809 [Alectoria sarmentosa]